MIVTLNDLPLSRLRRILRDTRRALGPGAPTVRVISRVIEAKKAAARKEGGRA